MATVIDFRGADTARRIVREGLGAGRGGGDVMAHLEGIVAGTIAILARTYGWSGGELVAAIDRLADRCKRRAAAIARERP